jgi:hypothetical protein
LSRNAKSKVTAGDRDPLKVGTGQTGNPKTIYEPYRKEALKAFEKFKKSGKPFAALDIAEEAAKKMKGKKGAIKNINIEQLAQNLTRSFFTEEQKKFFDIQGSKIDRLKKPGFYIEVSGRIKDILVSANVPQVKDKATIEKALPGKEIMMNDDGSYRRKIGGKFHEKVMMGTPIA